MIRYDYTGDVSGLSMSGMMKLSMALRNSEFHDSYDVNGTTLHLSGTSRDSRSPYNFNRRTKNLLRKYGVRLVGNSWWQE